MSEISFSMKTTHPQTKMTVCERDRFILCESDHLRRTVPSRGLSGDTTTCAILTPSTITVTSVGPDERKVYFTSSSVHDASTQTPPSRPQSTETSLMPVFRQGGKNPDQTVVALQEHFRQRDRESKVAVDLEWRMRAHAAVVYASSYQTGRGVGVDRAQEHAYDSFGMFRVTQPGPHDHAPHDAPAGAVVAPGLKICGPRSPSANFSR